MTTTAKVLEQAAVTGVGTPAIVLKGLAKGAEAPIDRAPIVENGHKLALDRWADDGGRIPPEED